MMGKAFFDREQTSLTELFQVKEPNMIDPDLLAKETIEPWKDNLSSTLTEEELMIPEPGSRIAEQVILESVESSRREFLDQVESRVDRGFAAATPISDYLRTAAIDVFVPTNWSGIKGIDLIQLEFVETPPKRMKPRSRRVPAAIYEVTKKEFQRLLTYFYEPSNSSITSPIVIAPKSTSPFVRICGDYRLINKLLKIFNFPIPDVIKELHKASKCRVFIDLDMRNAFHNLKLHPLTSELLSVQTPFGQFQPRFLPEGVAPASGILMSVMSDIFSDYSEWLIVIWDNILVCAMDYNDAFAKFQLVVDRCRERNIYLKLSKSWFGFSHAEFFGYYCQEGSYKLTAERIKEVTSIPFPSGVNKLKKLQHFLGCSVFFKPFIFNFADKVASLTEMTAKDFVWDTRQWTKDYRVIQDGYCVLIYSLSPRLHSSLVFIRRCI